MSGTFKSTGLPGVYYRLLKQKNPRTGKPDQSYYITISDDFGASHWVSVGRQSEGMTARKAAVLKFDKASEILLKKQNKNYSVGDAVNDYATWMKNRGKDACRYVSQYNYHCKRLLDNIPLNSVTPEQAEALKVRLLKKKISPQTTYHILAFLRRVINYAVGRSKTDHNPFRSIPGGIFRMPEVDNKRLRFLSVEECRAILDELKRINLQAYYMALLSLKTGMRATEIFHLKWSDIDQKANCLYIRAKGGKREIVNPPQEVIPMLLNMPKLRKSPYCFPGEDGQRRVRTPTTFYYVVKKLGIQAPKNSPYRITFHVFRHTFASWLAQSGEVTLYELMHLMRHKNIMMTQRYAHLIHSEVSKKSSLVSQILSQ